MSDHIVSFLTKLRRDNNKVKARQKLIHEQVERSLRQISEVRPHGEDRDKGVFFHPICQGTESVFQSLCRLQMPTTDVAQ